MILPVLLWLGGMSVLPATLFAAHPNPGADRADKDVRYVDCGSSNKLINSINAALASLDPSEDNTIYVRGACNQNVNITGFDRLSVIAQSGASITDASGGTATVVSIFDSMRVSLQGFTINGSGPSDQRDGIDCTASNCSFSGNTVQGAADGLEILQGARAFFNGDLIQDNGAGIREATNAFAVANGVTIQRNANSGVIVQGGATFRINNSTVQNNGGSGILIRWNGTAIVSQTNITGNAGDGIHVIDHSTLEVGTGADATGSSIMGNHDTGILVKDLSFARFISGVPNVVKNNLAGTDVLCSPQFPATRGALTNIGGGKTNCIEP